MTGVGSSDKAVVGTHANAALNGLGDKVTVQVADAFEALKELRAQRERYDVIVLDPPAFIKRRKDIKEGTRAYQRLNQMAMQVLAKDGLLVSASCSCHLKRGDLQEILLHTSRHVDRYLQVVEQGHQGPGGERCDGVVHELGSG